MTDESPLWHHFSADFQMPICDLFHLWVIFFFHCPWALRSIELPMAGQSNTETAADLHRRIMFPESRVWYRLTCFNTELWLILPSLFCMHFQIRPEMMRLVTKWRSLLHLLLIPQITFVEIYSLSATAGTNKHIRKDSTWCWTQRKDLGCLLEHFMCLLFDLSFFVCLVSATLPLCLPYSGFSFLLKPYSPLQMACCIQLGITQADSLIKVASKHSALLSLWFW